MKNRTSENTRLGLFVLFGLAGFVALLYFIGAQKNLFGKVYPVEVQFRNVSGLRVGNNVRMAGINVGTVKSITIVTDTSVLVRMHIDEKVAHLLKSNDLATIGTDGLMGNRIVSIEPGPPGAPPIPRGGRLLAQEALDMEAMMRTLDITNRNVAAMSEDLMLTVQRIGRSVAIWDILEDPTLPAHVRASFQQVREASERANMMVRDLQQVLQDIAQSEEGVVSLMKDSTLSRDIRQAAANLREVSLQAETLAISLNQSASALATDLQSGPGPLPVLLRDTAMTGNIQRSLQHVEQGTDAFNANMEALKHHFLFRPYFRKLEKKAAKEE